MGEAAATQTEMAAGAPQEAAAGPSFGRREAAAGGSIASIGLGAYGDIMESRAAKAGYEYRAEQADRAAKAGHVVAAQTDAQLREALASTIANIDAARASSNVDPLSPTGMALKAEESRVANRERMNKVYTIRRQAADMEEKAGLYRSAAGSAEDMGMFNASMRVLKALGKS